MELETINVNLEHALIIPLGDWETISESTGFETVVYDPVDEEFRTAADVFTSYLAMHGEDHAMNPVEYCEWMQATLNEIEDGDLDGLVELLDGVGETIYVLNDLEVQRTTFLGDEIMVIFL